MSAHHDIEAQVDRISELICEYADKSGTASVAPLIAIRAQLRAILTSRAELLVLAERYASECAWCDGTGRKGHSDDCDYWRPDYTHPCTCGQTRVCCCADIRAAIARATS